MRTRRPIAPSSRRPVPRGAEVLRAALLPLLLGVAASCTRIEGNRLNVLLVTIETTRADHLSAYGYPRQTSPHFDTLASEGALFEWDLTVSPRTNPSLASLMTSSYPHQHGVRNLLLPLEPENRTLAEAFRSAGYLTGAVQTHPRLIKASGLGQGFGSYDDDYREHPLADAACAKASAWIRDAAGGRPWFFWIHLMDPHWTYEPPEGWRDRFAPADPRPFRLYEDLRARRATIGPVIFQNTMPPDEVAAFVALYDAEIRFTDEALGTLLRTLDEAGLREKTVVVVTADHGESLGEHDYFFEHGDLGSEPEIHVPLTLRLPGRIRPGLRIPSTVRSIDVAPTLLDLAAIGPEPSFHGASLVPYLDGRESADRPAFGETDKSFHEENTRREIAGVKGKWRWVQRGTWKLVYIPHAGRDPEWKLYDLSRDLLELQDVGEEHPKERDELRTLLEGWMREDTQAEREYHISPETRDQLRSLGYVN